MRLRPFCVVSIINLEVKPMIIATNYEITFKKTAML